MPRARRRTASSSRSARSSDGSPSPRRIRSPNSTPSLHPAAAEQLGAVAVLGAEHVERHERRRELGRRGRDQRQIGVARGKLGAVSEVDDQIADLGARRAGALPRAARARSGDHGRQQDARRARRAPRRLRARRTAERGLCRPRRRGPARGGAPASGRTASRRGRHRGRRCGRHAAAAPAARRRRRPAAAERPAASAIRLIGREHRVRPRLLYLRLSMPGFGIRENRHSVQIAPLRLPRTPSSQPGDGSRSTPSRKPISASCWAAPSTSPV